MELPNPGDETEPNAGAEDSSDEGWPNPPVEVLPNKEPPDCEPRPLPVPKGIEAKEVFFTLFCPKGD